MKKRILSILLAVMMVVPMLTMAIPVSAADSAKEYYDSFRPGSEGGDIRNLYPNQVIDIGSEATTAPTVNGTIADGEYTKDDITFTTQTADAFGDVKGYMSVKGEHLYVGLKVPSEIFRNLQVEFGVNQWYNGEGAYARTKSTLTTSGFGGLGGWSLPRRGSGVDSSLHKAIHNNTLYKDFKYSIGNVESEVTYTHYEFKMDLRALYLMYSKMVRGEGVYETPFVQLDFWVATNAAGTGSLTQFCIPDTDKKAEIDTEYANINWVPWVIVIPESSHAIIKASEDRLVEIFNLDNRTLIDGQQVKLDSYAAVAPVLDGTVNVGEYTGSQLVKSDYKNWYDLDKDDVKEYSQVGKDIEMSYAVKDGFLYAAFKFEQYGTVKQDVLVQYGLAGIDGASGNSRVSNTIFSADDIEADPENDIQAQKIYGTNAYQNYLLKSADKTQVGVWQAPTMTTDSSLRKTFVNSMKGSARSDVMSKNANDEDILITTIEVKLSIPQLIAVMEDQGWNASEMGVVQFFIFVRDPEISQWVMTGYALTSEQVTNVKLYSGYNYHGGYGLPNVALPDGCIDECRIEDVYNVGGLSYQKNNKVGPSHATLDGVINASEYTSSRDFTNAEVYSADNVITPGISNPINGTYYFSYDKNYLYVGLTVNEPKYVSGSSKIQFNIYAFEDDKKLDVADCCTRANFFVTPQYDANTGKVTTVVGDYGSQFRSSLYAKETEGYNTDKATFDAGLAQFKTTGVQAVTNVELGEGTTAVLTYEIQISLAALEATFNIDGGEMLDRLGYVTYLCSAGGNSWDIGKSKASRGAVYEFMNTLTKVYNAGALNYTNGNDFFPQTIELVDYSTLKGASVRLTASNSGLRFKSTYTDDYLAEMKAYAQAKDAEMKVGTLIAPIDYVEAAGEFTHKALEAVYNANPYVEVLADVNNPYLNKNGVVTIAGSIVNINPSNYGREFAGIGFIQIGDEYFYSEAPCVKSISEVATLALADTKPVADSVYKYEVSAGVYSPYDEGKRAILNGFIVK